MKKQGTNKRNNVIIVIVSLIGIYFCMLLFLGFPIPRGSKVDSNYYTYYKNIFGIYYISVENSLALINHGSWGYLKDADYKTFTILDDSWAKDAAHVWFGDELITDVDVNTFTINAGGVAVDKNNAYIRDFSNGYSYIRPSNSGIDVETAEYFVYRLGERQNEWMRDKDYVYHNDKRVNVDRNSFEIFGEDWFIDKDFIYITTYNNHTQERNLRCIDSLQNPIEAGYLYFRNGKNILYNDEIIVRDIEVQRFEEIGVGKYLVNDMLFLWGKPFLKDSLDVKNAKFYFHGHIAVDCNSVFYDHVLLNDIDAATFQQIDDKTFEDKKFTYPLKERPWGEDYPFDKKRK